MIHSISIENFRSFQGPVSFDLKAHGSKMSNDFKKSADGSIYTSVASILGPNGSGKSNLIDALKIAIYFILHSFQRPEYLMSFTPHRLRKEDPTVFSIEFEINGQVYNYFFKSKNGKLIDEKLSAVFPRKRELFHRSIDNDRATVVINDIVPTEISRSVLQSDTSLISVGERFDIQPLSSIHKYFNTFAFDTRPAGLEKRGSTIRNTQFALKQYSENSNYLDRLNYIIERIDLGIKSVRIEVSDNEDTSIVFSSKRKYKMILDHGEFSLDLSQESSGTRCIIYLLSKIFTVIDRGGVLVSDELENHFHDDLFEEIIGIFRDPEYNMNGAQLIFSTNSTYALTFLNKYQVYLVEKNNNKSELYRMSEFSDIRETNNLERNYRSGKYGAVPKLRNIH